MSTYYLRKNGSDANNGLSPSLAFQTLSIALGTMASGDTLFIGAGSYRETLVSFSQSPIVETKIIGDITGINTGDSGEIIITTYLLNDQCSPNASAVLSLTKNFLTFQNITFIAGNANIITFSGHDIKFIDCYFIHCESSGSSTAITYTANFGVASNLLFNRCTFLDNSIAAITITLPTGVGSDYDSNILITNCLFLGNPTNAISVGGSGGSANQGGNVQVLNCTFIGQSTVFNISTNTVGGSTFTFPCKIQNCLMYISAGASPLKVLTLGQLIENYNVIYGGARTLVNIGAQSTALNSNAISLAGLNLGQLSKIGDNRPFFSLRKNTPMLTKGNLTIAPADDITSNIRNAGNIYFVDSGILTSSSSNTVTDSTKNFPNAGYAGYCLRITDGKGKGQTKSVAGNTFTVITGDGQWITQPDSTSKYLIYQGPVSSTSIVTSTATGIQATLTDSYCNWGTNFWRGYTCNITSGVGTGSSFVVSGNTSNVLTAYSNFIGGISTPVSGDRYALYWGSGTSASGIDYIHTSVGCYQTANTAIRDSGNIALSGINSIKFLGPAYQDFKIPVTGVSTIVSVWGYYDQNYSGTKPQLAVRDNSYLGISDTTGTMQGLSGQWERMAVTVTPNGNGIINARLISNSTGFGFCYFDAFDVN